MRTQHLQKRTLVGLANSYGPNEKRNSQYHTKIADFEYFRVLSVFS